MSNKSMMQRWIELFPELSVSQALKGYWLVVDEYNRPHRRYHTLAHIQYMLEMLDFYFPDASRELKLAIWLHDVIWELKNFGPDAKISNEELSAQFALELLDGDEVVADLIRATEHHVAITRDGKILCDLDLLFALDPETYRAREELVRQEFSMLSDEFWKTARVKFLAAMLEHDPIFQTAEIFDLFEMKVRAALHARLQEAS